MSTVQENLFVKQVDTIWDAWLKNLKTVQSIQDDVQEKALQAFTYQKDLLDYSVKSFSTIEEQSKEAAKEWSEKLQSSLKESSFIPEEQISKWLTNIQDVTETLQSISWKPSHVFFDVFAKAQTQLEENIQKALESQKTERDESFKKIEELIEQVKTAQKDILNFSKA